jgi:hypothetical protein
VSNTQYHNIYIKEHFALDITVSLTNFNNLNLIKLSYGSLVTGLNQFSAASPAYSKNDARCKSGQN